MTSRIFIVYCSPAGSTRHVARVIEDTLKQLSVHITTLDLGAGETASALIEVIRNLGNRDCLCVGSPVYRDLAVPPVIDFIDSLPDVNAGYALPFVTYGGATSGVALWQMGQALQGKGFQLAGAARVLGVHSMMWPSDQPVGEGHPDTDDERLVEKLVRSVYGRLSEGRVLPLGLDQLDYQLEKHAADMKKKCGQPWMIIPKTVDNDRCTQCGVCRDECPAQAIDLTPFPAFDQSCFDCYNCVRLCPEDAIISAVALEDIEKKIRERVAIFDERPVTQIFSN